MIWGWVDTRGNQGRYKKTPWKSTPSQSTVKHNRKVSRIYVRWEERQSLRVKEFNWNEEGGEVEVELTKAMDACKNLVENQ